MFTKNDAKNNISKLVENFGALIDQIKKGRNYKEAQVEDEFIKPLFKYLNWNTSNEGIRNLSQREFIVQSKGRNNKEPDYLLQLDGKPLFYMEAKHPKYNLFENTDYIWQAYSYAYSTQSSGERSRVDFAILTDFEEFRVFDCTFKAEPETVNNFASLDWKYRDYADKFDELWDLFERENIRKHRLNHLRINEKKIKQNRIPPDKAFLSDLDDEKTGWRILLAKDIKKFNPELSAEEITFAVQRIIDKFVFIKVLSDREIEDDLLTNIINKINNAALKSDEGILIESCKDIFNKINTTYNGNFFEPIPYFDNIKLSNKTLKNILVALTPEKSRYNFKLIPVEILGTIYEQFLGKIVCATEKRVHIEEKPEVRKAGGVYYTPQYIVDYIVENTVGSFLKKCETHEDMLKIRICDPACGSGSFLLGAYDRLLHWTNDLYFNKYKNEKQVSKKDSGYVYRDNSGEIRLTSKMKREILKTCIYGVDIDPQAVEVTKLSLSLKTLEDIRREELYEEVSLFNEKVLPDLSGNIKCGNSLIGQDFYDNELITTPEEERKIKPFEWKEEFKDIFAQGGFDCVIGNPPYFSLSTLDEIHKKYFSRLYYNFDKTGDIYCLFFEKALKILKANGLLSLITSNQWLQTKYGRTLRQYFVSNGNPELLINFGGIKIFQDATVDTSIFIIRKKKCDFNLIACSFKRDYIKGSSIDEYLSTNKIIISNLENEKWFMGSDLAGKLKEKIKQNCVSLKDLNLKIYRGILTGLNEAFIIDAETKERLCKEDPKSAEILKPVLRGRDVHKYYNEWAGLWLILSKNGIDIQKNYKAIFNHLLSFGNEIKNRYDQGENWYNLRACSYYDDFAKEKIIYPETTVRRSEFYLDRDRNFIDKTCFMITGDDLAFINGILSSKLIEWYLESELRLLGKRSIQYSKIFIEKVPIRKIDFSNPSEKSLHDEIVKHVDTMLSLNKKLNETKLPHDRASIESCIKTTDKKIDKLVYKLYNLTDDEIKIIEGNERGDKR